MNTENPSGLHARRVTTREAIAELQYRYHFWRTAAVVELVIMAIAAIMLAR